MSNNKISFFHSSFFDYCYARFYLDDNKSLVEDLLSEEQDLFVRSKVKSVLYYLRSKNHNFYINELKEFFYNQNIRFHLKHLMIKSLCFENDISDNEWNLIRKLIDSDKIFRKHFFLNIQSEKWIEYLVESGYLKKYLKVEDDYLNIIIKNKLFDFINTSTNRVLNFLSDIENYKDETSYILSNLRDWSIPLSIDLFKKVELYSLNKDYFHSNILNIAKSNVEVAINFMINKIKIKANKIDIKDRLHDINIIDYEEFDIISKMFEVDENIVLRNLLDFFVYFVDKVKLSDSKEKYFQDRAFLSYGRFRDDYKSHWQLLSIIKSKLMNISSTDKNLFLNYVSMLDNSKSITLNELIISCYLAYPEMYYKEAFSLIIKISDEIVSFRNIHKLIEKIYNHFSEEEKILIIKLIFNNKEYNKNTYFKLLSSIPESELSHFSELNIFKDIYNSYLSLKDRYYTSLDDDEQETSYRVVQAPYNEEKYQKMTLDDWEKSFYELRLEQKEGDFFDDLTFRWDIVEHSRKFEEYVSLNPDEYYDFIIKLSNDDDRYNLFYVSYGLSGLVKSNYDLSKIKSLISILSNSTSREVRREIIKAIEYIDKKEELDLSLIEILSNYSINDPDPENDSDNQSYDGLITFGLNTIRGSAVFTLGNHAKNTKFPNEIFEIFEKVSDDKSMSVKANLSLFVRNMFKYDEIRTFDLLNKLLKTKNSTIISTSVDLIFHFIRINPDKYFSELKDYISLSFNTEDTTIGNFIGEILLFLYLNEIKGSFELLEDGISKNNDLIKEGIIKLSIQYINNSNERKKKIAQEYFTKFMNESNGNISGVYDFCFYDLKTDEFSFEVFNKYSKSNIVKNTYNPNFIKYLAKCTRFYYDECINILKNLLKDSKMIDRHTISDAITILIESYNRTNDMDAKRDVLDILDYALRESSFNHLVSRVLEENDRY